MKIFTARLYVDHRYESLSSVKNSRGRCSSRSDNRIDNSMTKHALPWRRGRKWTEPKMRTFALQAGKDSVMENGKAQCWLMARSAGNA